MLLYVSLKGSDSLERGLSRDEQRALYDACQKEMSSAVARHRGEVVSSSGDWLFARFAPSPTRSIAATRALGAALAMVEEVQSMYRGLVVRAGVCDSRTPPGNAEEEMNIPKALSKAVDGGVAIDEAVRGLVGEAYVVEPLPALKIPGVAEAVVSHRVRKPR